MKNMAQPKWNWFPVGSLVLAATLAIADENASDGYIKTEGNRWKLGTVSIERVVVVEDGKLLLKSLKNKTTGRELTAGKPSAEFFFRLGEDKQLVTSATGPWKLIRAEQTRLKQGELQLDLTVQREYLLVTKSYVIYPGSSVIRQWITIKNAGDKPLTIIEPGFLDETVRPGDFGKLDFHWMTGADNCPGSWLLKTEKLNAVKPRAFDSYQLFPGMMGVGFGANVMLKHNDKQVWPARGWQFLPHAGVTVPMDIRLSVAAGDKLAFLQQGHWSEAAPHNTTAFAPTIRYDGGETHLAAEEFGDKQDQNGWRYQYVENGKYSDLTYDAKLKQWRLGKNVPFITATESHPGVYQCPARVWTAPKAGSVRITAQLCNTGNKFLGEGAIVGRRAPSQSYAPWYALLAGDTRDGVVIGWDYFGHWASSFEPNADGSVAAALRVAGYKKALASGESLTTPKAFTALFHGDLDDAGNEVLDWQYRYLWDYTRDRWFPAIRFLGYWMKGTGWGKAGVGWTGGDPDMESTFRKVFRVADLMRYVGGDVYHRDWGWWDCAGDWNGPDFRTTGNYLRKSSMGQLIYAFLYTIDPKSKLYKEHPEFRGMNMAKPEVVEIMKQQLDGFYERWGAFEWRNDSGFLAGNDSNLLGVDAGFRKVLQDFLDKHPDCAFQAVNGGGMYAGYDYARYSSALSFSDGYVGILRNYYEALLLPPDKSSDIPDRYDPNKYDKATWRGLLCINFDMTGDTWDPKKLEGLRELIDIYHYLHKQGVVGRWVKVHRPGIEGDDPTLYFQRLSRDRRRGIIIPKQPAPGPVTIKPKGLLPGETYVVTFHESDALHKRTGADLMQRGIALEKMPPGELIYLNLPLHPGSKLDEAPPTAPSDARLQTAGNMGYPGVELTWEPGSDDNWVSYYDVFRNGQWLDRVAKGTYYFDHSAGADLAAKYEVRTVDGSGNASLKLAATGPAAQPARVIDDAPGTDIVYTGAWKQQKDLMPAHAGTLSTSQEAGATVSITFGGKQVLWFSKLGDNAGLASVSVDNGPAETVDTYSADNIWGVCVYRKQFQTTGPHNLKITVLGQHGPRSKGDLVASDGYRIEQ